MVGGQVNPIISIIIDNNNNNDNNNNIPLNGFQHQFLKCGEGKFHINSFFYHKVRQVLLYKVRQVLQSAIGITMCDDYYKVPIALFEKLWNAELSDWFKANKLSLNMQKSNYINF